jgi:hypothetical protein
MSEIVGAQAPDHPRVGAWLRREHEAKELARASFPDLVRTHHAWLSAPHDESASQAYAEALEHFEQREGKLEGAYWCSSVPAAIAVTRQGRRRHFHRATAWAAPPDRLLGSLLNECDELGVRISEVLRGTGQRIAMGLVLCTGGNLLALADDKSTSGEAVAREAANLEQAQSYYRRAARRQAQLVYVGGMLLGVVALMGVVLAILALLHATTDISWIPHAGKRSSVASEVSLSTLYLCAISGALGANVSVASRIDENTFAVDYELGRGTIAALGMLRPVLGAIFGIALYAALASGLLDLFKVPTDDVTKQLYFFLVVAFLAGFSERWAKGMLVGLEGPAKVEPASPGPTTAVSSGRPAAARAPRRRGA